MLRITEATRTSRDFCFVPIVSQKSKIAGLRILAKNPNREAIADTYNFNHVTEVAYEFNELRCEPLKSLHEIRIGSPQNFFSTSAKRLLQHNLPRSEIDAHAAVITHLVA